MSNPISRFRRPDGTFPPLAGADPVTDPIAERYQTALRRLETANDAIQNLAADSTDEQRTAAQTEFDAANAECRTLREQVQRDREIAEARRLSPIPLSDDPEPRTSQRTPDLRVTSEPLTYGRHEPRRSFFLDLARVQVLSDGDARARLSQHASEQRDLLEARERVAERRARAALDEMLSGLPDNLARRLEDAVGLNQRALTTTDGAGGDFVPPIYLIDEYIPLARAGRPFVNACRNLPLPSGTDSINLPKISTGTATAIQATQNTAVQNTDLASATVALPVRTIAGMQTIALQLVEQSPINFDDVVFADLIADYFYRCEDQALNGSGSSGQLKGILNASGLVTVTYTDASPTVPELYPKIADGLRQARENRKMPVTHGWLAPRRSYWVQAALDSQNRPLVVPAVQGPNNALGVPQAESGAIAGGSGEDAALNMLVPHRMTDALPTNLGAGTNEDRVILTRNADHVFFEGNLRARVLTETKGDQLSVIPQVYNYVAFTAERYPSGIAVVAGTGLVTPTF